MSVELRAEYNHSSSFFFASSNLPVEREKSFGLTNASVTVTLPNRRTSVQIWGRNIFGVEYRTYLDVIDPARLEGWSDRATYGITLSQKF
jgi:outer membrane receptor protein involved in Fe transport